MNSKRVLVTRRIFPEALELIGQHAQVELWPEDPPPAPEQLRELAAAGRVHGLLTNVMDRVDEPLMEASPELQVISQVSVGLDNVDLAEATRRGHTRGVYTRRTGQSHGRPGFWPAAGGGPENCNHSDRWVREGNWQLAHHPMYWLGAEVNGATLGIVGLGQIGVEMAQRARGFDMRVIYYSRTRKPDLEARLGLEYSDLKPLLASADFVSLHVPLTPATRGLIGEPELRAMKSTAVLVNLSRGPVVDTKALCTALQQGWIRGGGSGRDRS